MAIRVDVSSPMRLPDLRPTAKAIRFHRSASASLLDLYSLRRASTASTPSSPISASASASILSAVRAGDADREAFRSFFSETHDAVQFYSLPSIRNLFTQKTARRQSASLRRVFPKTLGEVSPPITTAPVGPTCRHDRQTSSRQRRTSQMRKYRSFATARRMGQIDPELPYEIGSTNGR